MPGSSQEKVTIFSERIANSNYIDDGEFSRHENHALRVTHSIKDTAEKKAIVDKITKIITAARNHNQAIADWVVRITRVEAHINKTIQSIVSHIQTLQERKGKLETGETSTSIAQGLCTLGSITIAVEYTAGTAIFLTNPALATASLLGLCATLFGASRDTLSAQVIDINKYSSVDIKNLIFNAGTEADKKNQRKNENPCSTQANELKALFSNNLSFTDAINTLNSILNENEEYFQSMHEIAESLSKKADELHEAITKTNQQTTVPGTTNQIFKNIAHLPGQLGYTLLGKRLVNPSAQNKDDANKKDNGEAAEDPATKRARV